MPRVTQAPVANNTKSNSRRISGSHAQSPYIISPVKIPLNDDAQEKAARLQSRQALHEAQINQLKAVVTPTSRKVAGMRLDDLENSSPSASGSPRTPLGERAPRGRGKRQSMGPGAISSKEAIVAAAVASGNRAILGGRGGVNVNDDDDDDDGLVVGGAVVTPMKRVPILANFEEWMKMATDNKINATNSWNFALIDYFHDMSLLKEGDGVNFQKASCTLDGCVKIYTSRVDSVATETGKLLSGLADSRENKKKGGGGGDDGENSEDEDDVDEDGNPKKKPKKKQRSEVTLAPSFASLQLKKLELELAVDPLFKKASADFDEGGAKGLLLNHLMIDTEGRIVFDSSDDTNDIAKTSKKSSKKSRDTQKDGEDEGMEDDEDVDEDEDDIDGEDARGAEPSFVDEDEDDQDVPIDVASLGHRFFPELHRLEELDVCPSLKTFDLGDPSGSLDIPFLRAHNDNHEDAEGDKSTMFIDEDNPLGFDDTDALGFDLGGDVNFGEGGEAWAREARLEPQMRVYDAGGLGDDLLLGGPGVGGGETDDFTIAMAHSSQQPDKMHDNILGYFDQALRKNWASAEHWRIRKIKDVSKPATVTKTRKEKEPFAINFDVPLDNSMAELLFTQASSNTAITLPKKDWKAKSRNLLPDDKHFHSKQLLSLFLKPKARLSRRRSQFGGFGGGGGFMFGQNMQQQQADVPEGQMDEAFWASRKDPLRPTVEDGLGGADGEAHGNYDANFFADDGMPFAGGEDDDDMDGEEFADAREHFSPADGLGLNGTVDGGLTQSFTQGLGFTQGFTTGFGGMTVTNAADLAFGTTLVTSSRRVRPEYVQYARVAKRVDVRRLKEELWKGMYFDKGVAASRLLTPPPADTSGAASIDEQLAAAAAAETGAGAGAGAPGSTGTDAALKFTDVMNGLQRVYPKSMMEDISTSYCFITLLHLANEKGLLIKNTEALQDLDIRMDYTAEIAAEA
ncbi:MAG: hypothetical protein SEPTF4163_002335 [Sporothrix epigloea]